MIHGPRVLLVTAALVACSGARPTPPLEAPVTPSEAPADGTTAPTDAPAVTDAPSTASAPVRAGPVQVTALDAHAPPDTPPRVRITAPRAGLVLREDRVEVRLALTAWSVTEGRHVRLALDDRAPVRVDAPARPVVFERLAQGAHVLRAWAAWETGERVTTAGAMTATVFHVGEGSRVDARAPLLTCDAPDRSDNGSLDVQCAVGNTTGDVHVRATLDGAELAPLTVDTRYRIAPLPAGVIGAGRQP